MMKVGQLDTSAVGSVRLTALHDTNKDQDLFGSLDTNVTVVQFMDAARESVRTDKTVMLKLLP
jgi:hypothetical protein